MAYTLGDITLKNPVKFQRTPIEVSAENTSIEGRSTKDIFARKEQFVLEFRALTQAQVNEILSEYNYMTSRNFTVSETSLTIAATPVHIDIKNRAFYKGDEYREDLTLVLTEVT
jgi:hypothetical protein